MLHWVGSEVCVWRQMLDISVRSMYGFFFWSSQRMQVVRQFIVIPVGRLFRRHTKKNICIYGLKLRQIWNLDTNNKKQQQQAKKHHKLKNINSFCSFKDKMFTCFGVYISTLYEWSFMNDNWTKKITNQNKIRLQIYRMPQNICVKSVYPVCTMVA